MWPGLINLVTLEKCTKSVYDILKGFRLTSSVTRMGDLLHFGQLFQSCGKNYFAQIAHIFIQFL